MNNELDLEFIQASSKYKAALSAYGYNSFNCGDIDIIRHIRIILCHIAEHWLKTKELDVENVSSYIHSALVWIANYRELHEQLIKTSGKSSTELDDALLNYIVAVSAFAMGFQAYDLLPNWKESCYNVWNSYFNDGKIENKDEDTELFISLVMAMLDDNPEHNMANLEEDYKLFERKFPRPVDVKFIENTERKLSVKFPQNFKDKMKKDNGGELSSRHCEWWELLPFYDTTSRKTIIKTCNDIIRETKSAKKWHGLPENAIAIGTDRFGNYLMFLPKKDDPGVLEDVVYAWWPSIRKVNIEIKEIK